MKADEILKKAEELYLDDQLESATDVILESKALLDRPLFHYNLGSLYLKREKLGPARLHLEMAKKEGFSYPMLWKNLEVIKSQPQIVDPVKSRNIWESFSAKYREIPSDFFIIFFLLFLSISTLGLRKKVIRPLVFVFFLLLSFAPWGVKTFLDKEVNFAVVITTTRVFEGPSSIYTDLGEVAEGSRVLVSKLKDGWFYIVSPKEFQGWSKQEDLVIY